MLFSDQIAGDIFHPLQGPKNMFHSLQTSCNPVLAATVAMIFGCSFPALAGQDYQRGFIGIWQPQVSARMTAGVASYHGSSYTVLSDDGTCSRVTEMVMEPIMKSDQEKDFWATDRCTWSVTDKKLTMTTTTSIRLGVEGPPPDDYKVLTLKIIGMTKQKIRFQGSSGDSIEWKRVLEMPEEFSAHLPHP